MSWRSSVPGSKRPAMGMFRRIKCIDSSRIWKPWPCSCRWSRNSDLSIHLNRARRTVDYGQWGMNLRPKRTTAARGDCLPTCSQEIDIAAKLKDVDRLLG